MNRWSQKFVGRNDGGGYGERDERKRMKEGYGKDKKKKNLNEN